MKQQIILGMGAGQCGSETLAKLLAYQEDADVTHQQPPLLPWNADRNPDGIRQRLARIRKHRQQRFVGDVASLYLPYAEEAIAIEPEIRIICLKRPREEVVDRFCRHLDSSSPFPINHWAEEPADGWYHDSHRSCRVNAISVKTGG